MILKGEVQRNLIWYICFDYGEIEASRSQLRGTGTKCSSAQLIFDPQIGILFFMLAPPP
jgi:hypothetical protein